MSAQGKVSQAQLRKLVHYMEEKKMIGTGCAPRGPQAELNIRKMWNRWARELNAIPVGVQKTPVQWRRYWVDYKAHIKFRAGIHARLLRNGPLPPRFKKLNSLENRVLALTKPAPLDDGTGSSGSSSESESEQGEVEGPPEAIAQAAILHSPTPEAAPAIPTTQAAPAIPTTQAAPAIPTTQAAPAIPTTPVPTQHSRESCSHNTEGLLKILEEVENLKKVILDQIRLV